MPHTCFRHQGLIRQMGTQPGRLSAKPRVATSSATRGDLTPAPLINNGTCATSRYDMRMVYTGTFEDRMRIASRDIWSDSNYPPHS